MMDAMLNFESESPSPSMLVLCNEEKSNFASMENKVNEGKLISPQSNFSNVQENFSGNKIAFQSEILGMQEYNQRNEDQTNDDRVSAPILSEMSSNNVADCGNQCTKTKPPSKKSFINMKTRTKDLILKCEWNMCMMTLHKMEKFLLHTAEHVATVNGLPTNDGYICLWRACGFASHSKEEFDRHVYFHAFHAKIKSIGEMVMKQYDLQCRMEEQSRNMILEIPAPFQCLWDNCQFIFISAQDFYWHVQGHAIPVQRVNMVYPCSWEGCSFKATNNTRLVYHVRSHTQEKVVACPNCGSIFSGINKFQDHCHRHMSQELQTFECSHCKCKFATERLLKEHVRRHINHFKCPHCEMTCTTKGTMETHIKYRHTNNKPFKCPECPKRFKFQYDVVKHLPTHSAEASYVCLFPDCKYSCRSYSSYNNHVKKVHEGAPENPYVCHMCDQKFPKGFKLTQHLKNIHDYHWPAGHTRFRYSKDQDGFYKLQTTRFESMELAQEILKDDGDASGDDPEEEQEQGTVEERRAGEIEEEKTATKPSKRRKV